MVGKGQWKLLEMGNDCHARKDEEDWGVLSKELEMMSERLIK